MMIIEIPLLLVYVLKVYGWLIVLRDINAKRFWQMCIRDSHAKRIRMWISGEKDEDGKFSESIIDEIQKLLAPMDSLFKQDLALSLIHI